jgi:hypothetical protein
MLFCPALNLIIKFFSFNIDQIPKQQGIQAWEHQVDISSVLGEFQWSAPVGGEHEALGKQGGQNPWEVQVTQSVSRII